MGLWILYRNSRVSQYPRREEKAMMKGGLITIGLNCSQNQCGNLTDFIEDLYNEPLYIYDKLPNIILIATYIPLFLIALVSNLLVIIVVSRYRCLRRWESIFNLTTFVLKLSSLCPCYVFIMDIPDNWQGKIPVSNI
jgi:hypothetical protein